MAGPDGKMRNDAELHARQTSCPESTNDNQMSRIGRLATRSLRSGERGYYVVTERRIFAKMTTTR